MFGAMETPMFFSCQLQVFTAAWRLKLFSRRVERTYDVETRPLKDLLPFLNSFFMVVFVSTAVFFERYLRNFVRDSGLGNV